MHACARTHTHTWEHVDTDETKANTHILTDGYTDGCTYKRTQVGADTDRHETSSTHSPHHSRL